MVARRRRDELRRKELFGYSQASFLQASASGAYPAENETPVPGYYPRDPNYPLKGNGAMNPSDRDAVSRFNRENTYPDEATFNLQTERLRSLTFGYARNQAGEKVPYSELVRARTRRWTCPNCGCHYDLPT